MMLEDEINKVDYSVQPQDIPDSDEGNLRLYYELELLRSKYESDRGVEQLQRYATIIDVLGKRGMYMDFDSDLAIDKSLLKTDWDELISKPFADYESFDACVRSVSSRENPPKDPKAYCAEIMHRVERKET